MALLANFHTHCTFCDGKDTAEDMVREAVRKGFLHLGMSSHADTWFDPDYRMDMKAYLTEIRRLREAYRDRIEILAGVEMDCLSRPEASDGAEYVIGSTHYLDLGDGRYPSVDDTVEIQDRVCREEFGGDYYRYCRAYYDLEAQVVARTKCTFIGHFDLVTRFNEEAPRFDEEDPRYLGPAKEAMRALAEYRLPFEINTGALNRGRRSVPYPAPPLLRYLHELGGEIIINSDAHQKEKLDGVFPEAIRCAIRCGFTHTNILARDGGTPVFRQIALDRLL